MRKFHLFLILEAILVTLALLQILSVSFPRFIFLLVIILLTIKYYNSASHVDFLLTTGILIFSFIVMINPYVVVAILLGIIYMMINHFSQVKSKNRHALLRFEEENLEANATYQQWIGNNDYAQGDSFAFDDINIIRLSGSDSVDLENVIVRGTDNLIVIRKIYGPTKVLVPVDVAVQLDVSSIYGSVHFFNYPDYDLRNASIKLKSPDYKNSQKRVKIIINTLAGDVEVTRS